MERITLQEILEATGGKLTGGYSDMLTPVTGASSDNRRVQEGYVFFAFIGENNDGHKYVDAALDGGCAGCVVSRVPEKLRSDKFYVLVPDTIKAAGDLARYYRSRFHIPVIGITGSVGKTTTKDMIASVLSQKFNVLKTEGNFNNNIGLPRTIFRIENDTEIAVTEMGMNHLGEISYLTGIAKPTAVTITNIGEAHIGNLGSKDNIFRAKCEIFEGLQDGGFAVLNGDDEYLRSIARSPEKYIPDAAPDTEAESPEDKRVLLVGASDDCDFRAADLEEDESGLTFTAKTPQGDYQVYVPAHGRHLIYPALTAAAFGWRFGLSVQEIKTGILEYQATKMRMETHICPHGIVVYNDTYNANPQSMKAGIETLAHTAGKTHVAVLGDMFELGAMEEKLHREVGIFTAGQKIDALVTVGKAAGFIAEEAEKNGLKKVYSCKDKEEARDVLGSLVADNTAFLVKASRGMALESLSDYLCEKASDLKD